MKQHVRDGHQRDVVAIARAHDGFLSVIVIQFPILSCRI
jgi:hypothetical protein